MVKGRRYEKEIRDRAIANVNGNIPNKNRKKAKKTLLKNTKNKKHFGEKKQTVGAHLEDRSAEAEGLND